MVSDRKDIWSQNIALGPLYSTWITKEMGGGTAIVPRWQPHLPTTNRMVGTRANAGWSSRHYEGHTPDALQGSRPDCIRFETSNIGTMSGKSAEVVETVHR